MVFNTVIPLTVQSRNTEKGCVGVYLKTTRIGRLKLSDALGNLAEFYLLPGLAHDLRSVPELLEVPKAGHIFDDRAFDADWLREALSERKIVPVTLPRKNRNQSASYNEDIYKWLHRLENPFRPRSFVRNYWSSVY